ncbi:hypothetical protein [Nocardia jinanensis]|nr:hypothetical protein [Nocardia jinanensis]
MPTDPVATRVHALREGLARTPQSQRVASALGFRELGAQLRVGPS